MLIASLILPVYASVRVTVPSSIQAQSYEHSHRHIEKKTRSFLKPTTKDGLRNMDRKVLEMDDSGSCGNGVTYSFTAATGELTISGTGAMTDYSDSYNAPWFSYYYSIESVIISSGVTTIGNYTFCYCECITSVTIPNSITSIGAGAFAGCISLAIVNIPNSVVSIGTGAFTGCVTLTSVTIPNSVTSIEECAFSDCYELTSVIISNSISSIGNSVFARCIGLTSVTIPSSVTSI